MTPLTLHPDRLFSALPAQRDIARRLYYEVAELPIISPHGHTDPRWFASNEPFSNATELLVTPDHYLFRMLCSQGIDLDQLGVRRVDGRIAPHDAREAWRLFAANWHLFCGTPSRLWLDWVFVNVFGFTEQLSAYSADAYFDTINNKLASDDFRPRALFERLRIEVLATTESPLDSLEYHEAIRGSGWNGRVITAYRPDSVIDPYFQDFRQNVEALGELTGEDADSWQGYLNAHRARREFFRQSGATSTDHGHPTCRTADLTSKEAERLFSRVLAKSVSDDDAELFRAQMLTEMAAMSIDDGLVMQIHPGSFRNHNAQILQTFGRDKGFDIPMRTDYVSGLRPPARPFRARQTTVDHIIYARRNRLQSRACATGWRVPDTETWTGMVVPRFDRRHAPLPTNDDRNSWLLQYRRVQRRHARIPLYSGTARCRPARRLRLSCGTGDRASP